MKRVIAAEHGDDDPDTPDVPAQLMTPDAGYAMQTWLNYRLHHVYPEPGGYNDQDAVLMDDWSTLNLWYIRLQKGVELYAPENDLELFDVRMMMHD